MITTLLFLSSGMFLGWSLGANDAANVFGTAVGTKMIRFRTAALLGSVFVIIGAVISGAGASHFAKALDKVRAREHRELAGDSPLSRSKHHWLRNSDRTDNRSSRRRQFMSLTKLNLKTARAWRIKEAASLLWSYQYIGVARKRWIQLLGWISRSRLEPMIKIGKTIRRYLWGILNAIKHKVNNSMLEAKNTRIQRIKKIACGYRSRERFKTAILFHLGKLDLMPSPTR